MKIYVVDYHHYEESFYDKAYKTKELAEAEATRLNEEARRRGFYADPYWSVIEIELVE